MKKKLTKNQRVKIKTFERLFNSMNPISLIGKNKRLNEYERYILVDTILLYWNQHPELRLCQLISNIAMEEDETRTDLYYYEDRFLLKSLNKKLGKK